jgi:hypothetical protein
MITEQLMRPGRFDLSLVKNTPYRIWSAVDTLDHIVITPTKLIDPKLFSDAAILDAAIYTGVVTGKPTKRSFTGQGLAYWLGTDDGRGSIYETAKTFTNDTLSTVVASLLPSSITSGTITNTGTNLWYVFRYITPREALHFACKVMGAEWRINPDGTFDAATRATLFVTTPTSVIVRNSGGRDGARAYNGIDATEINVAQDIDGYTTKAIIIGQQGDGAEFTVGTATASVSKTDFFNNTVVFKRMVDAPDTPSNNVSSLATNVLAQYPALRQHLTLSSETYAVPTIVRPGDDVYVFDAEAGLYDTTRQLRWRGEVITPAKLRCKEYTWPVLRGMGVYARRSGATPVYTDLSEYVSYDDDDTPTEWVVGSGYNDPDHDPTLLGPAFLGKNADILSRITDPDWVTYTPTYTNITSGAGTFSYRLRGKKCEVQVAFSAGSATAGGFVAFTVPSVVTPSVIQPIMVSNGTQGCLGRIMTTGVVEVYKDPNGLAWTGGNSVAALRSYFGFAVT